MTTKQKLIEKLRAGGQITIEDIESLGRKNKVDPNERPAKVCSPKIALAKAKKGKTLTKWELEVLAEHPSFAVEYAKFTGRPFPECEDALILDGLPWNIKNYFIDVAKQPSKKFEDYLVNIGDCDAIIKYAKEILKARWVEGERVLAKGKNLNHVLEYQENFKIGRWKEIEQRVFKSDSGHIEVYFRNCGRGRCSSLEARLLKRGRGSSLFMYAKHCVRGRLPDALHNKMILEGRGYAKKYFRLLKGMQNSAVLYLRSIGEEERDKVVAMTMNPMGAEG